MQLTLVRGLQHAPLACMRAGPSSPQHAHCQTEFLFQQSLLLQDLQASCSPYFQNVGGGMLASGTQSPPGRSEWCC